MQKRLWILCFLAMTGWAFAQSGSEGKPKIAFEKTLHKFGEIDKGKKAKTSFRFSNKGKGTLKIEDVTATCGCTTAKPEKTEYAPGEQGDIEVTFDSTRFFGFTTKKVMVITNDPKNKEYELTIEGTVVSEIVSKPEHIFIADARRGEVSKREILVTTNRLEKLEIRNLEAKPEFLSAELERLDDQSVKIIVTADGKKFSEAQARPKGIISYETNGETQKKIFTNVTVNVVTPVSAHPRYAMFWATPFGKKREIDIRLVASDANMTFQIESLKSSEAFITVEKLSDDPNETTIKVVLTPEAPEGKFKGNIVVRTTHPEQKVIVIPLRGSVIKTS